MKKSTEAALWIAGGGALAGGFVVFRLFIRKHLVAGMMHEYQTNPGINGPAFMLAAGIPLDPTVAPSALDVQKAAQKLAVKLVPMFSFSIPDDTVVRSYIQQEAIKAGVENWRDIASTPWVWGKVLGQMADITADITAPAAP